MKKHGGNVYEKEKQLGVKKEDILDFSANISPLGIPQGVKDAMLQSIDAVIHYPDPDCTALKEALEEREEIEKAYIECGNGGADLLFRLALAWKPKKVLLTVPTFIEYEAAMRAVGSEIVYVELDGEFRICRDKICEKMREGIELFILCNPNNPTGLLTEREDILFLLEEAKKCECMVMIDECFLEIYEKESEYSVKKYLKQYKNLCILKSFTKLYAIPGVRLGYLLSGNEVLLRKIRECGQAWGVSHIAQCAGIAALKEEAYRKKTIALIAQENKFLKDELKKLGIHVIDGVVNYLFFYTRIQDLEERLERRQIMIRDCSNYQGLSKGYFRVAVRNHQENERLVQELARIKEIVGGF